jgi:uncharacterized protein YndB with AHSA1/START domain
MKNKDINNEIIISRIINASVEKVWGAWSVPSELAKWWGPIDFTTPHCNIDFRVGGKYLACMRGEAIPGQGVQDFWSGGMYKEIVPFEKIVCTDYFSNEKGDVVDPVAYGMSPDFPKEGIVTVTFEEEGDKTKLSIIYIGLADKVYKAMIDSRMKEGWDSSLDKLVESLS